MIILNPLSGGGMPKIQHGTARIPSGGVSVSVPVPPQTVAYFAYIRLNTTSDSFYPVFNGQALFRPSAMGNRDLYVSDTVMEARGKELDTLNYWFITK